MWPPACPGHPLSVLPQVLRLPAGFDDEHRGLRIRIDLLSCGADYELSYPGMAYVAQTTKLAPVSSTKRTIVSAARPILISCSSFAPRSPAIRVASRPTPSKYRSFSR